MDNFYDARRATEDMFDGQEVLGEESTPQDTPQEPQQEGQAQEPQQEGHSPPVPVGRGRCVAP